MHRSCIHGFQITWAWIAWAYNYKYFTIEHSNCFHMTGFNSELWSKIAMRKLGQDIIKASKHLNALKIRGNSVYVRKFMWIRVTQELKLWGLDGTHCCPQQPSVVLKSKNTTELKSLSEWLYPACVWFNHSGRIFAIIFTCFWVTLYVSFFAFLGNFDHKTLD